MHAETKETIDRGNVLYHVLADYKRRAGVCPSLDDVIRLTGWDAQEVWAGLRVLKGWGWIEYDYEQGCLLSLHLLRPTENVHYVPPTAYQVVKRQRLARVLRGGVR